jgi:uncharacterized protein (DUF433 family)
MEVKRMPKKAERIEYGEYIVADPRICHGALTFKGTRIFVRQVLDMVAEGMDWDKIVWNCHGSISKEAITESVQLAKDALLERTNSHSRKKVKA